jgi:hypothetical protein
LPNFDAFLLEMRKQPQVADIKEEEGSVVITLKDPLQEFGPFIKQVADLAENLSLNRYIKAEYKKVEVNPTQKFLDKMQPYCVGEPQKRESDTLIFLKPGIVNDYDLFREIRLEALKVGATVLTHPRPGLSIPNTLSQGVTVKDSAIAAFKIDVASLHADRLKAYYHKDTTQADAAESIKFLLDCGWSENSLCDLGVSRATFYRRKKISAETEG